MRKPKPIPRLHQAVATMLVTLMAFPQAMLADVLGQLTVMPSSPGAPARKVTLHLGSRPASTGSVYVVQTSTNLVDWQTVRSVSDPGTELLSLGTIQATDTARFYRSTVRLASDGEPPPPPRFAVSADDNGRLFVFPHHPGGQTFDAAIELANFGSSSRGAAIGDFDGDGLLDIAGGHGPGDTLRMYWFQGQADGGFADPIGLPWANGANGHLMDAAVGDFDVDGNLDLAADGNSSTVFFFWGRGDGTFEVATQPAAGGAGRAMAAGDFDEDGRMDVARATYSDGFVWVLLSNGDRTFQAARQIGDAGTDPYALAAGDFDGDGHLDLIADEGGSGDLTFFKGAGDGTFENRGVNGPLANVDPNDHCALDSFDFDEDGRLDLVMSTYEQRSVYFFAGLGDGTFSTNRITLGTGFGRSLGVAAPPLPPRVEIDLVASDSVIPLNGEVTFMAAGPTVDGSDPLRWTFGDETASPLAWGFTPEMPVQAHQVTHRYDREGRFVARFWHTSSGGIQSTRGAWITVQGQPPVAAPGGPYTIGEEAAQALVWTTTLDASASTDDFGIARYIWEFGDGTRVTNTVPTATHSWTNVGPWTVDLVVEDTAGLTGAGQTTVTFVPGEPPVAQITGPALVDETAARDGQWTVRFSAENSTDDAGIWKYEWQFGDGKTASGRDVTTKYGAVGTYTVTLTVTDHAGQTDTTTHEVTIQAGQVPVPVIDGPRLLTEVVATNGLWFGAWDARASTDDTGIYRYEWSFGDGGTATGAQVTHQYGSAGTFPLSLRVTDHGNQTETATINVLVVPGEFPVARIAADPLSPEGRQPVSFSAAMSTDDRGIRAYRWLFPPRSFDFAGQALDADQWAVARGRQDEALLVTGTSDWGAAYFFTLGTRLLRGGTLAGRVDTPTEGSHAMVGMRNLDFTSGHYNRLAYGIYFADGEIRIYEYGSGRGKVGEYTKGQSYDFRIETKPGAGAIYSLRPSGTGDDFVVIFNSDNISDTAFGFGADVHSGTYGFDDFVATGAFVDGPTTSAPVFPGGQVRLEVVDHATQTNVAVVSITPVVGQLPVAVINGPSSAQAGVVLSFEAYRSSDDHGIASYTWNFGDASELGFGPAVNHRYDTPGRYTNTVTVTDYAGQSAQAALVIDIAAGNAVVGVPWRIVNGVEQPHETFSGREVTLKAVARNLPLPFDYVWDFGDGSESVTNTATTVEAAYGLEARHVYSGTDGTPFYAAITVVLTNGVTLGDTYPLVLRPKSLNSEMNVAIDEGLWYMHKTQARNMLDAQNRGGWWNFRGYAVNLTATAVQAFGINGHQYADEESQDPYVETVQRGIHYLLTTLATQPIGPQAYGDPDGNQNGIGLYTNNGQPIYQTGPLMDALVACTRPELIAPVGGANVRGRALRDILQDLVDLYCWAQYDDSNVGGGWRYGWNDHPDNSAAQWGAIGLMAAERYWGIAIPSWVKERNLVWVRYSKGGSGFGYTGPGDGDATTPSAMVQLSMDELPTTDPLWMHGQNFLGRYWSSLVNNHNLYAHYAIAKALRTAYPQPVEKLTYGEATWDWFLDPAVGLARFTVDRQRADGTWLSRDGYVNEPSMSTAYSLVILSSSLFQRGPVAVIQFRPNPSAVGFPVIFDARASYHQHPAYQVVDYRWDFDAADGFDFDRPDAVGSVVTNIFGMLGTNQVTLQVRDNASPMHTDIASVEVRTTIPPFPPTADTGGPYYAAVGQDLHLDGSGSFDVDAAAGDYLTAWDWEIDFAMPLDFDDGIAGERAVIEGGFPVAGQHRLGLRVSDATSIVFPTLGLTNLTGEEFATVFVYERVIDDLRARAKENKIQLTWTKAGDYATVLRSTIGPDRGFEIIGQTDSDYATFLDTNVVLNTEYYYRLLVYRNAQAEPLGISDPEYIVSRPRTADNRPPTFQSTPERFAQVGQLYQPTLDARDPENDPMTFAVLSGPTNLTVNAVSGAVLFTPVPEQVGSQFLSFEVANSAGRDVLSYTLYVFPATNQVPVAVANGPYAGLTGEPIQFSSTGSGDPDGQPLTYTWNFGDGVLSTNPNPTHVYAAAGDRLVTLFVNDGFGGTASAKAQVRVDRPNRPPVAVLAHGPQFAVRLGETLTLDASASYDLDGDSLEATWVWGDGEVDAKAGLIATHVYAAEGQYAGNLTLQDGRGGEAGVAFEVTVAPANQPPHVEFTLSADRPYMMAETLFDATASLDPEGDPLSFAWDFGDRTKTTGPLVTHAFRQMGSLTVTLRVTDDRGGATEIVQVVEVVNAPPEFASTPPLAVRASQPYAYTPTVTDLNDDSFSFVLVSGPPTMTCDPTTGRLDWLPAAADEGSHPVVLRTTDPHGDAADQSFSLVVTPALGLQVDLTPSGIVMTNVTIDSQTLALAGTATVRFRNLGADPVPVPYTVSVFVDVDGDGAYAPDVDRRVGWAPVAEGLSQGFDVLLEMTVRGQAVFKDNPLLAFVDSEDVIPELEEANNIRRAGFDANTNKPPVMDVSASWLRVDRSGLPDQARLTARLGNCGVVPVPANVPVAFYDADPAAGGALLGVARTSRALDPGQYEDVTFAWLSPAIADYMIQVSADDEGDGAGTMAEISEINNAFTAPADLTANEPPVADAGADQDLALGDVALLNGRGSSDPEGRPLTYRWAIRSLPVGSLTQLERADTLEPWLAPDRVGEYVVQLVVNDGFQDGPADTVTVLVSDPSANHGPTITSRPSFQGMVGVLYEYAVQASDPDGDPLAFRLTQGPAGMTIAADSGLLRWTPAEPGVVLVQVEVSDGRGAAFYQGYSLTIEPFVNVAPEFTSVPPATARPGEAYVYSAGATDANRDPVTYALAQAPAGMTVNAATGVVTWTPSADQFGGHTVILTASDNRGASVSQTYSLTVFAAGASGPVVLPLPDQTVTEPATFAPIPLDNYVTDPDDADADLTWVVTGTNALSVSIGPDRVATVTYVPGTAVAERLTFLATDPQGQSAYVAPLFTVRGTDQPPVAAIANLSAFETTSIDTGAFELFGTADDPDFADAVAYRMTLYDAAGRRVAAVTPAPVNASGWHEGRVAAGGSLGKLNFTAVRNGAYQLLLEVRGGALTANASVPIALDCELKLGQFSFSQRDLVLPLHGLGIQISRTYDSLNPDAGDFGYGWTYNVTDLGFAVSEDRAFVQDVFGERFSQRMGGSWDVTLDLPDSGRRVTFRFTLEGGGMFKSRAVWHPPSWVKATLVPTCSPYLVSLTQALPPYWEAAGINTDWQTFDFPGFILTLADGTQYRVDRKDEGEHFIDGNGSIYGTFVHAYSGAFLTRITERSGTRTEFVRDSRTLKSIDEYNAADQLQRSLVFQRDAQNRITAAYAPDKLDPSGQPVGLPTMTYVYDEAGNLVQARKLVDETDPANPIHTTVEYGYTNPRFPHYLTEIRGGGAQLPVRFEYDDHGRLIGTIDPQGNRTTTQYDDDAQTVLTTDRLGHQRQQTYDGRGLVTASTDPLGNTTRSTYDDRGYLTAVIDPLGHQTTYTYDDRGNQTSMQDALGQRTQYEYDEHGNQTAAINALGHAFRAMFDAEGKLLGNEDALGQKTEILYDDADNVEGIRDAAGNVPVRFGYDDRGFLTGINPAGGNPTTFTLDERGNPTAMQTVWTNPDNPNDVRAPVTQIEVNEVGQLVKRVDPQGNVQRTVYNADGQAVAFEAPAGGSRSMTYDPSGNLIEIAFADGTVVRKVYDAENREILRSVPHLPETPCLVLHQVFDPAGRPVRSEQLSDAVITLVTLTNGYHPTRLAAGGTVVGAAVTEFDAAGRKVAYTDASSQTTRFEYDAVGRPTATIDPLGHRTEQEYDAAGRRLLTRDALGREQQFLYDNLGRVTRTVFWDGNSVRQAYTPSGLLALRADELGRETLYEWSESGQLDAVVLPAVGDPNGGGAPTAPRYEYTYDAQGNRMAIQDPAGSVYGFRYDEFRHLVAQIAPGGERTTFAYDTLGRVQRATNALGQVIEFQYDGLGHLTNQNFYAAGSDLVTEHVTFTPDALGRVVRIEDASGVTEYTYDDVGSVRSVRSPEGFLAYDYDPATRRPLGVRTDFTEVRYEYDALGRVAKVLTVKRNGQVLAEPEAFTYTYTATGRRASLLRPNGVSTRYTYDLLDRLVHLSHVDGGGQLIASYDYALAANGRRTNVVSIVRGPAGDWTTNRTDYAFDALDRLVRETVTTPAALLYRAEYTYDLGGDRVRRVVTSGTLAVETAYTYNANHQLLTARNQVLAQGTPTLAHPFWGSPDAAVDYAYNAEGALIQKQVAGSDPSETEYRYDLRGRLIQVVVRRDDGTGRSLVTTADYRYDHTGLRTGRQVTTTVDGAVVSAVSQRYLLDRLNHTGYEQVLEERDQAGGAPSRTYAIGTEVLGQTADGLPDQLECLLPDGLGSTRQVVDSIAEVIQTRSYDAWGASLDDPTLAAAARLGFAGEAFDPETGAVYLRARYYDPEIGRFQTRDRFPGAAENPYTQHPYAYAHLDPVNRTDPGGYFTLAEVTVANHIRDLIIKHYYLPMAMRFFSVLLPRLAEGLIPEWARNILKDDTLIVGDIYGASLSAGYSWAGKFGTVGFTGIESLELIQSLRTSGCAVYFAMGAGIVVGGSAGGSGSVAGYGGALWNCSKSTDYAGHTVWVSFTFPIKADWADRLAANLERGRSFKGPLSYEDGKALQGLLGTEHNKFADIIPMTNPVFNVGVGLPAMCVAGTKPSALLTWPPPGKSPASISAGYTWGWQLFPLNKDWNPIDLDFK